MTEPHGASFKKKLNDRIEPNSGPKPTKPISNDIVLNDIIAMFTLARLTTGFNLGSILWVTKCRGIRTRFCMVYEFN